MKSFEPIFKGEGVKISKNEGQNCQSLGFEEFENEIVRTDFSAGRSWNFEKRRAKLPKLRVRGIWKSIPSSGFLREKESKFRKTKVKTAETWFEFKILFLLKSEKVNDVHVIFLLFLFFCSQFPFINSHFFKLIQPKTKPKIKQKSVNIKQQLPNDHKKSYYLFPLNCVIMSKF